MKKEYITPITEETNTVTFNVIALSSDIGTNPVNPDAAKERWSMDDEDSEDNDFYSSFDK